MGANERGSNNTNIIRISANISEYQKTLANEHYRTILVPPHAFGIGGSGGSRASRFTAAAEHPDHWNFGTLPMRREFDRFWNTRRANLPGFSGTLRKEL
jgi:hypothetical protein